MAFQNSAFYSFFPLENPARFGESIKEEFGNLGVRGTLILAPEGINGFLAGLPEEVQHCLRWLQAQQSEAKFSLKHSFSDTIPFEKFQVKLKSEIVTFRVPHVEPTKAPYLSPQELKRWYEEKQEFLILDTRNEYEFQLGAFENATSLGIDQFVELAKKPLPEDWKKKKLVTYCTGGIRCEKAAPYLRSLGFDAYQLDGGILNYFEQVGGDHWQGECFVFDERVALNPQLKPTGARLCENCQWPLPALQLQCPNCGTSCQSPSGTEKSRS